MSHEKENRSPTLDEFKARVREKFNYLKSEFGMHEVEPELRNEFCVAFANKSTRVEVEGINWGFGLQSYVGVRGVAPREEWEDRAPLSGPSLSSGRLKALRNSTAVHDNSKRSTATLD